MCRRFVPGFWFIPLVAAFLCIFARAAEAQTWSWRPMPMLSRTGLNAGVYPGGEGCQYPQIIAIDSTDGSFILYGTDVGGIYRSTNGGARFEPCNIGIETAGGVGFAIDPRNPTRCLTVGDGGGNEYNIYGGIHLSTNRGATWSRKLTKWLDGIYSASITKGREQIAYDPSSFSPALGYCTVAYWVEEGNPQEPGGGLFKTTNGGGTWALQATPDKYGGADRCHSLLKIHPSSGLVYIANTNGFYRSTNGGVSFTQVLAGNYRSLDVVASAPGVVWTALAGTAQIWKSVDSGATFTSFTAAGISQIYGLKVSPVNTNSLLASDVAANYRRCYSTNGGLNWFPCGQDMTRSWFPASILYDDRCRSHAWHPTNATTAWCIGPGDIISRTTNSGAVLKWENNGNNGIMLGGGFNLNAANPDILYFGSQDYNGALSTNGGRNWDFINLSIGSADNDPWGWVYGAYAADSKILFGGNRAYQASDYALWITFNGGASSSMKVASLTGIQVSYGDPRDTNVLFCWSYRSGDRGVSWNPMTGCQGVFTHDRITGALYGAITNRVVTSLDKGLTWTTVATLSGDVLDVAIAATNRRVYAVTSGKLWKCDAPGFTPALVNQPNGAAASVAVDPQDERVLYVAGTPGTWRKTDTSVVRSINGGLSWEKLNNRADLKYDGGNCASWCRVHPATRDLWVGTVCFGMWRFGAEPEFRVNLARNPGTSLGTLSWLGAAPPYVVESAMPGSSLSWSPIATNYLNTMAVPLGDPPRLFRVGGQPD